ncbi:MAG: DUF1330 domain-containing protein [Sphingomonadaceae bacterium]|nr:DUF1330 domain-containing protein [Sphingomonadaceae bacterium]
MPGYMVMNCVFHDIERFVSEYAPKAAESLAANGGKVVFHSIGAKTVEGDFGSGGSFVMIEFPTLADAEAAWFSDEYQELKRLREGLADFHVLLVEGEFAPASMN